MQTRLGLIALFAAITTQNGAALGDPTHIEWADLRQGRLLECADMLNSYLSTQNCTQQGVTANLMRGRFSQCAPGFEPLDGQEIRIAGYAHPLELEFSGVTEFLLIPALRSDCRHPPPPLPDQIISVVYPDGLDVNRDPVWVTGVLRVLPSKTHLADTSYVLEASEVLPALIPDVTNGDI